MRRVILTVAACALGLALTAGAAQPALATPAVAVSAGVHRGHFHGTRYHRNWGGRHYYHPPRHSWHRGHR